MSTFPPQSVGILNDAAQRGEPAVGSRKQSSADSGMKGNLPHKDKERHDRQPIGRKDLKGIPGHKTQACTHVNHITEPKESQEAHHKSHGHPGEQEEDKDYNADDSNGGHVHLANTPERFLNKSVNKTRQTAKAENAMP